MKSVSNTRRAKAFVRHNHIANMDNVTVLVSHFNRGALREAAFSWTIDGELADAVSEDCRHAVAMTSIVIAIVCSRATS